MRRHPNEARLIRGHPGGGQSDVLWIRGTGGSKLEILLNRRGTIQVHGRADGRESIEWEPTDWSVYLSSEPRSFIERLERAAGWSSPSKPPASTPTTLTYRVFAALASFGIKSVRPLFIEQGFIDTSGYGGGPNENLRRFAVPASYLEPREDDLFREPGYRFWIVMREQTPLCAIEQTLAVAWFLGHHSQVDLMSTYRAEQREPVLVAAHLLSIALRQP